MERDEIWRVLKSIHTFLLGMWIDPGLPSHIREAVQFKIDELDNFLERLENE